MSFTRDVLDNLSSSISLVTENGSIEYRNRAFMEAFGNEADVWIRDAARAVAGERGWLHGSPLSLRSSPPKFYLPSVQISKHLWMEA